MTHNSKANITVNSLISIIISIVVILILFSCAGDMITQSDKYADDMIAKLDNVIEKVSEGMSETQMTLKFGDASFFAYFEPGATKVRDDFATLKRPSACEEGKSCFCYCDEFRQDVLDKKYMMQCDNNKDMECRSYDMEFEVTDYNTFFDSSESNDFSGGFFLFKMEGSIMHDSENIIGFTGRHAPYSVKFKERLRFERDSATKKVTLCLREDGGCFNQMQ